jgi:hypothetical protein
MKAVSIKITIFAILCCFLLLAAGCSKVTKENFDKLKVGQNYDEVVSILGKADACRNTMGIKNCTWGDNKTHISVKFVGDKAVIFSSKGL